MKLRHPHRRASAVAVLAAAVLGPLLAACGSDAPDTAGDRSGNFGVTTTELGPEQSVVGTTVATLDQPIDLEVRPGDDGVVWVAERAGTIRRLSIEDDGTLQPIGEPVLDLSDETTTDGERGLLSIAFSADGTELFTSSTDRDGNTLVAAYPLDATAVTGDARTLFRVEQPFSNHNGGNLVLHDGALWLGLGDGGAGDDPDNRAQDDTTPLGKLVRIDPATGEDTIVAKGLRNPWRFAFDTDGSIWIADVGQNAWEEIDHLAADRLDGANFGWSGYEATHPYLDGDGRRPQDPVMPVYEYGRENGECSITGGFPYHGNALTGLDGAFLFADLCVGRVQALRLSGEKATVVDLGVDVTQPISFGQDADGEAFVLSADGAIVKLTPGS